MDARTHEPARAALHAMVSAPARRLRAAARRQRMPWRVPLVMLPILLTLVAAVAGGLLRAGVALPGDELLLGRAALEHAALMIGAFLGSVVAIERAVALKHRAAFLGPLASIAAGFALLLGQSALGAGLLLAAALGFVVASAAVLRRQRAPHTALLLLAALCWLAGNAAFALGIGGEPVFAAWFAFLVMTIAAERLEMARLMRQRRSAQLALFAILGVLVGGAALCAVRPAVGGLLYGAALLALAVWLGLHDIARRTVHAHGLSRYMAVCLLSGYAWLGVAGLAWAATALGWPARDAALHALGLGFIVAMMMAHAPVILPAVARLKLRFGNVFYLPLLLLQASLVMRLGAGATDPAWRGAGAVLNAAALALFLLVVAGSALAWRHQQRSSLSLHQEALR